MDLVAGINRFISLFVDTVRQFGRGKIWLVLFIYFLLNWLVLQAHYSFLSPAFYGPLSFWTGLFGDQRAVGFTHYPGHFLLMPYFFGWAKFVIGLLLEGAILGAVALIFYQNFLGVPAAERSPARSVVSSWIHLVLGWALINSLILLVNIELPGLLQSWLAGSPRRIRAFDFGLQPFLYVLILAIFFFLLPRIAIYRENVLKALKGALANFGRNPVTSFCLALVVFVVPVYLAVLVGRSPEIVSKFRPELVYWLLGLGLVVDMLFFFFWMGTAVRFLVEEET